MSLTVYNGSPRGKKSNSSVITNWFTQSIHDKNAINTFYLTKTSTHLDAIKAFEMSQKILCVFPLYVDGMPGQVKAFFELLSPLESQCSDKTIVFIIHSGFSEAIHCRALEQHLKRLCAILGIKDHSVIIMPGSEGFRLMPPAATRKKAKIIASLGANMMAEVPLNEKMIHRLQKTEVHSSRYILFYKFLTKFGLTNAYWDSTLKKNQAYEKRFDAPYTKKSVPVSNSAYRTNNI